MKLRLGEWIGLLIVLVTFGIGYHYYPNLPEMVASHWNAQGQVDGYTNRFWGAFLIPTIEVGLFLLLWIIPVIDPKKANIKKFRNSYDIFVVTFLLFLTYLYLLTINWSLGKHFDMTQYLVPGFAALFFAVGFMVEKSEPNYMIGVRTPWTLASESVWRKTNVLGGKLFKYASVIILLGFFVPNYSMWFLLVPIMFLAIFVVLHSYLIFRSEKEQS